MGAIGSAEADGRPAANVGRLLLAQAFVAAAMTGVIWQVQLVTYPQFLNVGPAEFPAYHAAHTTGIGALVAPLMLAELGLSLAALWFCRNGPLRHSMRVGAALVLALWATTWLWQVPLHARLEQEGRADHRRQLAADPAVDRPRRAAGRAAGALHSARLRISPSLSLVRSSSPGAMSAAERTSRPRASMVIEKPRSNADSGPRVRSRPRRRFSSAA